MIETLTDVEFVRELAKRAKFVNEDATILWRCAKEIIVENISKEIPMTFHDLLNIRYRKYKGGRHWDAVHRIFVETEPATTVKIAISKTVRKKILKRKKENERLSTEKVS